MNDDSLLGIFLDRVRAKVAWDACERSGSMCNSKVLAKVQKTISEVGNR